MNFKVMLASQQMPELTQLRYPCYVQPKLDGYRAVYIPNEGFYSRSCKKFRNENLKEYFKSLDNVADYVLDGELYIHGIEFQNLASTISKEGAEIKDLVFVVYDCIPIEDFKLQKSSLQYEDRLKLLRSVLNEQVADFTKVIDISTDKVDSPLEIRELYKKYLKNDYEGVIIRRVDGNYKFGRSTIKGGELIKLKPFKSLDLKVVDVYEGENQFEGSLGGIICSLPNGSTTRIGSGFSVDARKEVWSNKKDYLGKTAEIKYFEETEENNLRHPIFIRWRDDK